MAKPPANRPDTKLAPANAEQARGQAQGIALYRAAWLSVVLFLVVVATFLPALRNGFISYDDDFYVTDNPHVQSGLTWANVTWAFQSTAASNWHPLTWLSHMLDCQIYGLRPWGHHLTSVLLHAGNAVLLFLLLNRMTRAMWRSLFVAALLGLHPLHVESVAWAAERKDVLSTLFFLLTLLAYVGYARRIDGRGAEAAARLSFHVSRSEGPLIYYCEALVLFALGLLSKPMLVTLPFVLLLLDFWPLARFRRNRISVWTLLLEKTPFLILAAASSAVTLLVQRHAGAVETLVRLSLTERIGNALVSYCRYLGKLVYPVDLALFYPHPHAWPSAAVVAAGLLLGALTAGTLLLRRRAPFGLVGWLWFLGTLVPVLGLVQVGMQAMADRYSYIPSIGIFILVSWAVSELARPWRSQRLLLAAGAALALGACSLLTLRQLAFWRDSRTLFSHSLAVTDANPIAHLHLGNAALQEPGHLDEAIQHFRAVLRVEPGLADAHGQLGAALYLKGDRDAAIAELRQAINLNPGYAPAHFNLGVALQSQQHWPEAIAQFNEALRCRPEYAEAENGLASALASTGHIDDAIPHFKASLRLKPDYPSACYNLGLAYLAKGRRPEAIHEFQRAVRLRPGYPEAEQQLRALAP